MCEYFLLIPIDVPRFNLIEGQIKELQEVVPNTPPPPPQGWEWPKKPGQDRIKIALFGVIQAIIDAYWCSVFRFWNNVSVLL